MAINNHGKTRWVTLENALRKMLQQWSPLKDYFGDVNTPRLLRDFFSNDVCKCVSYFLLHVLEIFSISIKRLEVVFSLYIVLNTKNEFKSEKAILPQLCAEMDSFKNKIRQRMNEQYFGQNPGALLNQLPVQNSTQLISDFMVFYFLRCKIFPIF